MGNNEKRIFAQDGQTVNPRPPVQCSNLIKKGQTVSPLPPKPPQAPPPQPPPAKK